LGSRWPLERVQRAIDVLGRHHTALHACEEIGCSYDSLKQALRTNRIGTPSQYLMGGERWQVPAAAPVPREEWPTRAADAPPVQRIEIASTAPCAPSPERVRATPERVQSLAQNAQLDPRDKYGNLGKAESVTHYLAGVSCTHYGGRHNCTAELEDFVDWCHNVHGITVFHHAGDLLQGIDPKWSTEAKRNALDDQCDIAIAELPRRHWLHWRWIAGNHDMKHERVGGLDIGRYVGWRFTEAGRDDLTYLGPFCGTSELVFPGAPRPIRVELAHKYGGGENLEPTLRRFVRNMPRKHIPDFALFGHPHRSAYAKAAFGIHAAFCGTFDVARYGRAYAGGCDVGGVLFGFELDGRGNPARVLYQFREYDVEQRV
jgi:hypothetical protein